MLDSLMSDLFGQGETTGELQKPKSVNNRFLDYTSHSSSFIVLAVLRHFFRNPHSRSTFALVYICYLNVDQWLTTSSSASTRSKYYDVCFTHKILKIYAFAFIPHLLFRSHSDYT